MGILKKIKKKIIAKKEEGPEIEIKEKEEVEEEKVQETAVEEKIIEKLPKVIEERKETEMPLIVIKEEEEIIVEKKEEAPLKPIEQKEEEGEIVSEEEGVSIPPLAPEVSLEVEIEGEVEESLGGIDQGAGMVIEAEEAEREISQIMVEKEIEVEEGLEEAEAGIIGPEEVIELSEIIEIEEYLKKVEGEREEILRIKKEEEEEEEEVIVEEGVEEEDFAGLPLGERFMKWFEKVFLGNDEVVEATKGLEDTICSFICQDTQFYIEKKGIGNPARIVEGRSLKPDAHVRVSATAAENVIKIKNLTVAETVLFKSPKNINIKFNIDVLDLTKKGYLRVPILRKIVR
ncbi:MAG: hypothetical protein Q6362_011930 [Candidatus Wukongarchaeota archaeon]|nr:hypothetical protein [Candidatus Wukongarchaeota archaeon]